MDPRDDLTLLTISRLPTATPYFQGLGDRIGCQAVWYPAAAAGYLEAVLDTALTQITTAYVFRLDDDEWPSPPLVSWLQQGGYRRGPHWKFPRLHRWGRGDQVILNAPLWPDWQTRLSVRAWAGSRDVIHAGSPFGGGTEVGYPIMHDKLLKPLAEREQIAAQYDQILPGAGLGAFLPFHLPERVWSPPERVLLPAPWLAEAP